jgi:hypothetical protein
MKETTLYLFILTLYSSPKNRFLRLIGTPSRTTPIYRSVCMLIVLFVGISCGKKVMPVSEKKQETSTVYNEDLSEFRNLLVPENQADISQSSVKNVPPAVTTEPLYENDKLDAFLNERAAKNKNIKFANGYRIQIYVGRERQIVDNIKVYIYQNFPNLNPYLSFSLPIYKLKVGDFLNKSDADRVYNQIKGIYPEAMIIPDKIDIKKSFMKE